MGSKFLKWLIGALLGGLALTFIFVNQCVEINQPPQASSTPPTSTPAPTLPDATPANVPPISISGDGPSEPPEIREDPPWTKVRVSGCDSQDRCATFDIAILAQEDRWVKKKWDLLESGPVAEVLPEYLGSLEKLLRAKEIIVVGTASEEGNLYSEEARADRRADAVLRIVRPLVHGSRLYKLNLGRHIKLGRDADTSYQRRVILAEIEKRESSMGVEDIRHALYDALDDVERFSFNALDYSSFLFSEV
jgi:hypothetical protein